jgi:phosphoadenosine phosphosulfate reductase
VLVHLVAEHDLPVDLVTLDTGLLFPETVRALGAARVPLWRAHPGRRAGDLTAGAGRRVRRRPVGARARSLLRHPQGGAARGDAGDADAWISAIRRDQTPDRASAPSSSATRGAGS